MFLSPNRLQIQARLSTLARQLSHSLTLRQRMSFPSTVEAITIAKVLYDVLVAMNIQLRPSGLI